jgi:hypothetical protein
VLLFVAGLAGPAGAQEPQVGGADARAIEQVIRAQLDAFASDDAGKAFSYAAPGIRRAFRTPENFIAMVRHSYPVVYRPAAVTFLKPETAGREVLQPVRLTDNDGTLWLAIYTMQRQPGGAWLTNGCHLGRTEGQVT